MKTDYRELCLEQDSAAVESGKGGNIIPPPEKESLWIGYLRKFTDPLIVVLLIVFCFSVAVSVYEIHWLGKPLLNLIEPLGVLLALLLATGVGYILEVKADREFDVLNKKRDERPVKVLRWQKGADRKADNPQILQLRKCDVVVGDVVRLESGDEVPADGRLIESRSLRVDESAFTGEMYTKKSADVASDAPQTEAYPVDFLLRGSILIEGHCHYQVTAVGVDTEEGRGAMSLREESQVETPLNKQLRQLSRWITNASYLVAALIVVGRLTYYFLFDGNTQNNSDLLGMLEFTLDSILIAVTLIVVAVPEGLPMSVTMSMALSMRKMLKENNLVRKLHACETMGAATVICTDKTGTLTKNKLNVLDDGDIYTDIHQLALGIAANSTAELTIQPDSKPRTVGNPTEGSLLYWLYCGKGIDYRPLRERCTILEQVNFTSETKHMITVVRDESTGRTWKFVKGAPEVVLALCDEIAGGHTAEEVNQGLTALQKIGRRTLGFAYQEIVDGQASPMVFAGFVGMADPVREDVRDAVQTCQQAGVRVIMVTGDVALTANEIARETGIMSAGESDQIITGAEFAEKDDDTLKKEVLPTLKVLSRARPTDKSRLVTLLQEMGHVVAVTGDGTNDALALKKAQIGLSMGDGTARAKEASDITIIDNSFVSINKAIMWGRSLYVNIQRFLLFQMTINICACLIVLAGAFMGLDSPLNVTQMLWVNLIMDTFAAMALSSLPPDKRVMLRRPRDPESHIIDRQMALRIISVGLVFFLFLFGVWQLLWHLDFNKAEGESGMALLLQWDSIKEFFVGFTSIGRVKQHISSYELGIFFSIFVMMQFWNIFNAKYFRSGRSLIQDVVDLFRDPKSWNRNFSTGFLLIVLVIFIGQVFIVNQAGQMFGVSALMVKDWLLIVSLTSLILVVPDIVRFCTRKG